VQDFEKQLAQKDEELMNTENKMFGEYGISVFQKCTPVLVTGGRYQKTCNGVDTFTILHPTKFVHSF
jgi:hypothetical protein